MKPTTRLRRKIERTSRRSVKHLFHRARPTPDSEQRTLFIVGCQRSGTSMVADVMERDPRARVFYEFSSLSSESSYGLRFNPLDDVHRQVRATKAPIVVAKPLVESQRITEILDRFEHGHALWMYRSVDDVVSSNLKRWGEDNGTQDLQPLIEGDTSNWRSEGASSDTLEMIRDRVAKPMETHEAAALFWLARNQLFFDQNLAADPRVILCNYEDLTADPRSAFDRIYNAMGQPGPSDRCLSIIRTSSVGKGRSAEISPDVRALCDEMTARLRAASTR